MTRFLGQKRGVERGGHSFDDSEDFKQAKHGCTGLTFTRGPLAKGEDGDAEIISGPGFIKIQAFECCPHLCGECARGRVRTGCTGFFLGVHGVGFSGVRKTRHGAGFVG
jgi:hypothetical protein